jgi:hypothetical protein
MGRPSLGGMFGVANWAIQGRKDSMSRCDMCFELCIELIFGSGLVVSWKELGEGMDAFAEGK